MTNLLTYPPLNMFDQFGLLKEQHRLRLIQEVEETIASNGSPPGSVVCCGDHYCYFVRENNGAKELWCAQENPHVQFHSPETLLPYLVKEWHVFVTWCDENKKSKRSSSFLTYLRKKNNIKGWDVFNATTCYWENRKKTNLRWKPSTIPVDEAPAVAPAAPAVAPAPVVAPAPTVAPVPRTPWEAYYDFKDKHPDVHVEPPQADPSANFSAAYVTCYDKHLASVAAGNIHAQPPQFPQLNVYMNSTGATATTRANTIEDEGMTTTGARAGATVADAIQENEGNDDGDGTLLDGGFDGSDDEEMAAGTGDKEPSPPVARASAVQQDDGESLFGTGYVSSDDEDVQLPPAAGTAEGDLKLAGTIEGSGRGDKENRENGPPMPVGRMPVVGEGYVPPLTTGLAGMSLASSEGGNVNDATAAVSWTNRRHASATPKNPPPAMTGENNNMFSFKEFTYARRPVRRYEFGKSVWECCGKTHEKDKRCSDCNKEMPEPEWQCVKWRCFLGKSDQCNTWNSLDYKECRLCRGEMPPIIEAKAETEYRYQH